MYVHKEKTSLNVNTKLVRAINPQNKTVIVVDSYVFIIYEFS